MREGSSRRSPDDPLARLRRAIGAVTQGNAVRRSGALTGKPQEFNSRDGLEEMSFNNGCWLLTRGLDLMSVQDIQLNGNLYRSTI